MSLLQYHSLLPLNAKLPVDQVENLQMLPAGYSINQLTTVGQ
jgi:hypothetical protein